MATHHTLENAHLPVGGPAAAKQQGSLGRGDLALIAVERTRMPMITSDPRQPDNPIVLANPAFLKLTGYAAGEVIGRNCRFLQGPDTDRHAVDQIRASLSGNEMLTIELVNYRKDGSKFWNQLHISPIHDDDGQLVYHFASQLDVTRRREAHALEQAEYSLLREVDHRAKNALALVQGIVRLSQADNIAAYSQSVQRRVDALAVAHGLLAERRWQAVPLDSLIIALVRGLGLAQVSLEGPPLAVAAEQVQPLALLLHELLGNALQHGALSAAAGTLTIDWQPDANTIAIRLAESGGPCPATTRSIGFGLRVVDAVARRQLRGDVSFDWAPSGLVSVVVIPHRPGA